MGLGKMDFPDWRNFIVAVVVVVVVVVSFAHFTTFLRDCVGQWGDVSICTEKCYIFEYIHTYVTVDKTVYGVSTLHFPRDYNILQQQAERQLHSLHNYKKKKTILSRKNCKTNQLKR